MNLRLTTATASAPTLTETDGVAAATRLGVLFVSSAGGHLAQLLQLSSWYADHDRTWVTFRLPDAVSLLQGEKTIWGHFPTTRNIPNLLRNMLLAVRVIRKQRPSVIVSSGAAIAVPFFWIGKLYGAKTVYVEVIDRIDTRTLDRSFMFAGDRSRRRPRRVSAAAVPRLRSNWSAVMTLLIGSVGTDHHPFPRLLNWMAPSTARIGFRRHRAAWATPAQAPLETVEFAAALDLEAMMTQADVVVCHGGPEPCRWRCAAAIGQ